MVKFPWNSFCQTLRTVPEKNLPVENLENGLNLMKMHAPFGVKTMKIVFLLITKHLHRPSENFPSFYDRMRFVVQKIFTWKRPFLVRPGSHLSSESSTMASLEQR